MKKSIVVLAAVLTIAAIRFHARAADKLKVGFVYLGSIGDLGWNYQHDVGRKKLLAALGDRVETTYLENVPESADAERDSRGSREAVTNSSSAHRSATWSRPSK